MPKDEFEQLLERCSERLSEITLSVPTLESGGSRPQVYSLFPQPAPPKAAAPPPPAPPPPPPPPQAPPELAKSFEPAPAPARPVPAPPRPAAPPAPPPPAVEERAEDEIFPPARLHQRTPPPSVPLWRARPEPTPEPRPAAPRSGRRNAAAAAAAAALAAAGAFGVWLMRRPPADLDLEVGDADAMAVRPDKGDLIVAEGRELVDLARDGRALGRRPLDAPVSSLRWAQGFLWSADGRSPSIVQRADDGRATVFTLNHVPGSIFVSDKYLWTAEREGHKLHQFLISRSILGAILQPIDSFEVDGLAPESFAIDDGGALWIADEPSRRLFQLRLENGSYRKVSSAPLSPFVGPEGRLRGLTIDDGAVWILTRPANGRRASLRRIILSRLDWTPA